MANSRSRLFRFFVLPGDTLVIDTAFLYELAVGIEGWNEPEFKAVDASVQWFLDVVELETGNVVDSLGFGASLGLANINDTLVDPDSGTLFFQSLVLQEGVDIFGGVEYGIVAAGREDVIGISQNVPEPGTIIGLLAISGLGLGLKRKKQS